MKLAIIYDMLYPYSIGGAEIRNYHFARELSKKGHEVHLFGVKLWEGKDAIKKDGLYYHGVCRYKQKYKFNGKRSIFEPLYFSYKLFFYFLNSKQDFDIIDCASFPYFPVFACKVYSMLKRKPLIITWHEYWGNYWYKYLGWKGFFGKIIEKLTIKLTDNIVAVSDRTKSKLITAGAENVIVIPNAINFEKIGKVKPRKEKSDVIYSGRLMKHKNIDFLIKAVALLKVEKSDIRAIIIGEGPEKNSLINLVGELNLQQNIKFFDFFKKQENIYRYMKSAKVFVLPSTLEGFGIVALEAMACNLPVVTIKHKDNAAMDLVDKSLIVNLDETNIAEKIKILLKDKSLRKKIVTNALKKVKRYNIKNVIKNLETIYTSPHTNP